MILCYNYTYCLREVIYLNKTSKVNQTSDYKLITVRPNSISDKDAIFLTLMEQRILIYAIFKAQNTKSVTFTKQELEQVYKVKIGSFSVIEKYLKNLRVYGIGITDETNEKAHFINAFQELFYDAGVFRFTFSTSFLPQLKNERERYFRLGVSGFSKFKSKYSLYFYNYLKDCMWGPNWIKEDIPLLEFRNIFKLEPGVYENTHAFMKRCWKPVVDEINQYTLYKIEIKQNGYGKGIRYTIIRHQNEDFKQLTKNKPKEITCHLGKIFIDEGCNLCMKINKCPNAIDTSPLELSYSAYHNDPNGEVNYIEHEIYKNKQYNVYERIKNKVASNIELSYFVDRLAQGHKINEALQKYGPEDFVPLSEEEIFDKNLFESAKQQYEALTLEDNVEEAMTI
ncbi:replication initiator protein [[Clostridium] innocuum]|nr:replication initiator protein [[Clostridium] innocuum]SSA47240.1 Initiator Replication protein [[Clostridium] innocuum]